jgi:hypothetical protein
MQNPDENPDLPMDLENINEKSVNKKHNAFVECL